MLIRWSARWTSGLVALLLFWGMSARAQDLVLTQDCDIGFQQLIHAAQSGELGNDVTNANVGASPNKAQVELVRPNGTNKLLFLTRKSSTQGFSRYFDIELGAGATASDAARVGKILDTAFQKDPFEVSFDFFGARATSQFPTVMEAWKYGGWMRVLRVLEGRLTAPVGVGHATAVVAAVALAALASLILLWGSEP